MEQHVDDLIQLINYRFILKFKRPLSGIYTWSRRCNANTRISTKLQVANLKNPEDLFCGFILIVEG